MDFVDVLITLGIFAVFIGSEVVKIKKKMASSASQSHTGKVNLEEDFESLEEDYFVEKEKWKNEKIEPNSSKSSTYFSYEDVSASEEVIPPSAKTKPSSTDEIHLQEVENETETLNINLQDPEEVKKAIIYGEILKNPYN